MPFQWDRGNIDHIARHDVTPAEAEQVVENDPLEIGRELRNGEERIVHLGETDAGRILIVPVTLRGDRIRVVSAYDAPRKLRTLYRQQELLTNGTDLTDT